MSKTLAINAGSSSLKFQLLEMPAEKVIAKGQVERIGMDEGVFTLKYNGEKTEVLKAFPDHRAAIEEMLEQFNEKQVVSNLSEITGVGHRVVAGGEWFNKSVIVDDEVLEKINRLSAYAPLHNPANAAGIEIFRELLPDAVSVAVFDTAFHQTMPRENYLYSLPYEYYTKYGARKYGAHGNITPLCFRTYFRNLGTTIRGNELDYLALGGWCFNYSR